MSNASLISFIHFIPAWPNYPHTPTPTNAHMETPFAHGWYTAPPLTPLSVSPTPLCHIFDHWAKWRVWWGLTEPFPSCCQALCHYSQLAQPPAAARLALSTTSSKANALCALLHMCHHPLNFAMVALSVMFENSLPWVNVSFTRLLQLAQWLTAKVISYVVITEWWYILVIPLTEVRVMNEWQDIIHSWKWLLEDNKYYAK